MQVNPYLFYNGNCEEALKYYQKALGAQIEAMMPYGDGPADIPVPPDWKTKLMHARITIDGEVMMASDATPGDEVAASHATSGQPQLARYKFPLALALTHRLTRRRV